MFSVNTCQWSFATANEPQSRPHVCLDDICTCMFTYRVGAIPGLWTGLICMELKFITLTIIIYLSLLLIWARIYTIKKMVSWKILYKNSVFIITHVKVQPTPLLCARKSGCYSGYYFCLDCSTQIISTLKFVHECFPLAKGYLVDWLYCSCWTHHFFSYYWSAGCWLPTPKDYVVPSVGKASRANWPSYIILPKYLW